MDSRLGYRKPSLDSPRNLQKKSLLLRLTVTPGLGFYWILFTFTRGNPYQGLYQGV